MRIVITAVVLLLASLSPAMAQSGGDYRLRDETSRLAVAVLGRICLLNLGDINAVITAASPRGEFGFVEATPEVAKTLLQDRSGYVRVLRRPGFGAVTLMATHDGICSVFSEYADITAFQRHLTAMVERGGLKGGANLLTLDARDADGVRINDYYLMPTGWFAAQLGKRFGDDGTQPLALVTTISNPGRRPMEGVLTVSRPLKQR
ncbi:hypothetical protein A6A04_11350 [Paramagnetospirillum marisnigri]|uniref:Uncharacterized protein n=1 Tax=Paramagnetospirillum marisnigri TaxID=1285242 RepID=A0A178MZ82_9PROT|nr:hypothetical protein [Paramagnetospirillum marisnigri]OAN55248.1 hypothetical protein A6A04_11350 [Paramagnetospirillum marisnigri]